MSSNSFVWFGSEKKMKESDWAHKEALIERMNRICDAEKARTDAVLNRLGASKSRTTLPLKPSTRHQPPAPPRQLVSPLSVERPATTDVLNRKTPMSPETLERVNTSVSLCSSEYFSSDDNQTPCELREIPLIKTPEVFLPQTAIVPTPPPQPTAPPPRKRKSLIPVMIRRILKRPEKEAISPQRAEPQPPKKEPKLFRRNVVAPLRQPATAPKTTILLPSLKPDPPKNKQFGPRTAVGFKKTMKVKKPALRTAKPLPDEELKPLLNPVQSLSVVFQHLDSDEWEKKVEGLKLIRALAQHHPDRLISKQHEVCVAVLDQIKNTRSSVACAAINTLGSLYTHLQKNMDVEVERSGQALLLRIAQASGNVFVRQQVNLALEAMVRNCSPGRVLTTLHNTGLSHLSVAVKACAAQQLHLLADEMGATAVLTAGRSFTPCFLRALSKMALNAAAEVRHHGYAVLQALCLHKDFMKMWQTTVGERERFSLKDVVQKARRTKTSGGMSGQ